MVRIYPKMSALDIMLWVLILGNWVLLYLNWLLLRELAQFFKSINPKSAPRGAYP